MILDLNKYAIKGKYAEHICKILFKKSVLEKNIWIIEYIKLFG